MTTEGALVRAYKGSTILSCTTSSGYNLTGQVRDALLALPDTVLNFGFTSGQAGDNLKHEESRWWFDPSCTTGRFPEWISEGASTGLFHRAHNTHFLNIGYHPCRCCSTLRQHLIIHTL